MSLPTKVIDRLFERLAATYGAKWVRQWDGVPMADVKSAWAHELSGFHDRMTDLAWALGNLPEPCPNAIEFRNLCRKAPQPESPRLPEPKADPERLRVEFAKLGDLRATIGTVDHKAWARRIITNHTGGLRVSPISLRFAREALRMGA